MNSTIVVIGKSPDVCNLLKKKLNNDVELKIFGNGKAALSFLKRSKNVGLIISDFQLPDMDSIDLAKASKAIKHLRRAPHIVVSSSDNEDDKIACLQAGAIDFIVRPFHPREFELRIRRFVSASILQV